jgi:hypothetical protein
MVVQVFDSTPKYPTGLGDKKYPSANLSDYLLECPCENAKLETVRYRRGGENVPDDVHEYVGDRSFISGPYSEFRVGLSKALLSLEPYSQNTYPRHISLVLSIITIRYHHGIYWRYYTTFSDCLL